MPYSAQTHRCSVKRGEPKKIDFKYTVLIRDLYICAYYSMYTKKGKEFVLSRSQETKQGSTPLSLVLLPVLYVLLRTRFVTSRPSCLAWDSKNLDLYY